MHYIGLGKRSGERSALGYEGLDKRKSALKYIGLGKKKSVTSPVERRRYADSSRRVSDRGRRRAQLRRRWASSTVDPGLLAMGIGRK